MPGHPESSETRGDLQLIASVVFAYTHHVLLDIYPGICSLQVVTEGWAGYRI